MDIVRICLKKEYSKNYDSEKIYKAKDSINIFWDLIGEGNIERVGCIFLDAQYNVLCYSLVGFGNEEKTSVNVAELFRTALLSGSKRIIVAHNHPSGVLIPTNIDIEITKRIGSAGMLLDIFLIDSLIIGNDKEFVSIREYIENSEGRKNE
jgi:DNA repair protein RadC